MKIKAEIRVCLVLAESRADHFKIHARSSFHHPEENKMVYSDVVVNASLTLESMAGILLHKNIRDVVADVTVIYNITNEDYDVVILKDIQL